MPPPLPITTIITLTITTNVMLLIMMMMMMIMLLLLIMTAMMTTTTIMIRAFVVVWHSLIGQAPAYLTDLFYPSLSTPSTTSTFVRLSRASFVSHLLAPPPCRAGRVFSVVGPLVWNGLPLALQSLPRVL